MNNDEQQIRRLLTTWMEATKQGDIPTVLGLMTDDVVFLVPGQPPMLGKAAYETAAHAQLQSAPAGQRPQFEGGSEIQELQVLGEWAFMWTRLHVTVTPPGGAPVARAGHTLTILRKEHGAWKLARDANLLSPVAKSGQSSSPSA